MHLRFDFNLYLSSNFLLINSINSINFQKNVSKIKNLRDFYIKLRYNQQVNAINFQLIQLLVYYNVIDIDIITRRLFFVFICSFNF